MDITKEMKYARKPLKDSEGLVYATIKDDKGQEVLTVASFGACTDDRVVIKPGVKVIQAKAFAGCQAKEILLPNSLETIGEGAFMDCPNLTNLRLPPLVNVIAPKLVANCPNFRVLISAGPVFDIGDQAFFGTSDLLFMSDGDSFKMRTCYDRAEIENMRAYEDSDCFAPEQPYWRITELDVEKGRIFFGTYPQKQDDAKTAAEANEKRALNSSSAMLDDGEHYANGKNQWFRYEPIEWQLLKREGDDALLITREAVDVQEYSRICDGYEKSTIRSYLNHEFIHVAFSAEERKRIATTKLDNSYSFISPDYSSEDEGFYANEYCVATEDKIFLLSDVEWETLLKGKEKEELSASDYARSLAHDGPTFLPWCWLRTIPDVDPNFSLCVQSESQVIIPWPNNVRLFIRPAMWIRLTKEEWARFENGNPSKK